MSLTSDSLARATVKWLRRYLETRSDEDFARYVKAGHAAERAGARLVISESVVTPRMPDLLEEAKRLSEESADMRVDEWIGHARTLIPELVERLEQTANDWMIEMGKLAKAEVDLEQAAEEKAELVERVEQAHEALREIADVLSKAKTGPRAMDEAYLIASAALAPLQPGGEEPYETEEERERGLAAQQRGVEG